MPGSTPGLDPEQVRKAATALLKFVGSQREESKELLQDDEVFQLLISLSHTPQSKKSSKPVALPVPHSLYDYDGAEICLLVKDRKGEGHKEAKARVRQAEIGKIAKVVGLSKLRTKYESFEAKRQLCAQYDLFLADDRILPFLPKLLGKSFFKKKKQPIPLDLTRADWGAQVKRACSCTYLFRSPGSCLNIRVARSNFSERQCSENIIAVLQQVTAHIPKKWDNVQAVFLKTADSVALPLYQVLPEAVQKISA
ncbi:hypothetical protein WJX74_002654 [Apatococcus lobatus]|uniref:Ribosomal protein L1 n=1 Tax=Apatococcus lobatus TaxID=904363 RepID=A0AAW1QUR6_9CHLO